MSTIEVELIPGLPEDIAMGCLIRLPHNTHHVARRVSKRWRDLIDGGDLHRLRKQSGESYRVACMVQALTTLETAVADSTAEAWCGECKRQTAYGVSVFDPVTNDWELLDPIPGYPNGLPLFCQLAGTEGKLVVLGGWDPVSWDPVRDVWVYDFKRKSWRRCADMPSVRSFFAVGVTNDVLFVAGGHDMSKNALKTACVYDVGRDLWMEAPEMGEERDECEGVVIGSEFWVVGGYNTDEQGRFCGSTDVLDLGSGKWRTVEGAWFKGRSPRGCVGVGKGGGLVSWADVDPAVRIGTCAVGVGDRTILSGYARPGARSGLFLVDAKGEMEAVDVPVEFSGFVQSGCSVEL
ncbi:F-box/kelch-repeat protein [Acorus gramineus]|uniref:F-box/kelch-repeat protein n=1 Tax=Acorus gramineus TaxID=55184 RepID=A0AAV9AQS2_ACOGR|nr:F-box/kelch-repeat protein [Acorus gramineus]